MVTNRISSEKTKVSPARSALDKAIPSLIPMIKARRPEGINPLVCGSLPILRDFFRYLGAPEHQLDDLAQDTLEKVLSSLDSYDTQRPYTRWLLTIARHIHIDNWRSERARERRENMVNANTPAFTSSEGETLDQFAVADILGNLPPDAKILLELRVLQEMSFAEIGELTGEKEVTVRSRFFRLMSKLRENKTKGGQV
ncbi:MAG: RNA polymerase sigma factor [Candidatus Riflebacteria bacterium]|nr:RNA polymerase sigma factor [Candidatus Riflebacteria bacterium]